MTSPLAPQPPRNQSRGWGIACLIIGGIMLLAAIGNADPTTLVVALAVIGLGIFLVVRSNNSPAAQERKLKREGRFEEARQHEYSAALNALAMNAGGQAVIAHRNLYNVIGRWYPESAAETWNAALRSIHFDSGRTVSPLIGNIPSSSGVHIEVYRDWIIYGQFAYDVDETTGGQVYVDAPQYVGQVVEHAHASIASSSWSMSAQIHYSSVPDARRVLDQLSAHAQSLKGRAITQADIQAMVDAILNNTGQPPAEKIQQLSNLRYQRLLSDTDFEQARTRILGIG